MKSLTDLLLEAEPYGFAAPDKEPCGRFCAAMAEELCFHYDHNALYRAFCRRKNFDPHAFSGDIREIPPIMVSVFKALGGELASVPPEHIRLTLHSSATGGTPSTVPLDKITSARQKLAMIKTIATCLGNDRRPFLVVDLDPTRTVDARRALGARYAAISGYLNFASEVHYLLRQKAEGTIFLDEQELVGQINALQGRSVVVFGFTYLLYSFLIRQLAERGSRFGLPAGSTLIHIGGWKKLESEKISREAFNRALSSLFSLESERIIDIYGFTEQMGLNYPDCSCGCKHATLYSEPVVRDPVTLQPLPPGREGLLEFVSPLPHSYPGSAVLTDDLGVIVPGECPAGRAGTRFKVLGRLKNAEIRGCGDILAEKLKRSHPVGSPEPASGPSAAERVTAAISMLEERREWLSRQPVDLLIGLIAQVAAKWTKQADHDPAVHFLSTWCSAGHLTRLCDEGLRGNRHVVDGFVPADDQGLTSLTAVPRGLVCHFLSGNVPVLGMFALVQSMLCHNVNLIRISDRDQGTMTGLLEAFDGETYRSHGGRSIQGSDLKSTVELLSFPHTDLKALQAMSEHASSRIAWGGAEAMKAVAGLPVRYDCADIMLGPKLSLSVIGNEMLSERRKAAKLARQVAVDASVFDQSGCASTHNVFVERGGAVTPEDFAALLAEGMAKVALQIPKAQEDAGQIAAIHAMRGIYDFKGRVFADPGSVWTVLYDEETALNPPVYSRVVFVHPIDTLDDVLPLLSDDIQSVGLAVSGGRAHSFARTAAMRGVLRFPSCGRMLNFQSPWDGMFIMERLVKWISSSGPL